MERITIINNKRFNVPLDKVIKLDKDIELSKQGLLTDMLKISMNIPLSKITQELLNTWNEVLFIVNTERLAYLVATKNKKFYKEYLV